MDLHNSARVLHTTHKVHVPISSQLPSGLASSSPIAPVPAPVSHQTDTLSPMASVAFFSPSACHPTFEQLYARLGRFQELRASCTKGDGERCPPNREGSDQDLRAHTRG